MKKYLFGVVFCLLSVDAFTATWTGALDVTKVGVRGDGTPGFYFLLSGTPKNPDECGLVDHYFVRATNEMYKEMFSLVLAAKKSASQITVYLDGCDNGRPKVTSVVEP